jgi:hypothetical protein
VHVLVLVLVLVLVSINTSAGTERPLECTIGKTTVLFANADRARARDTCTIGQA